MSDASRSALCLPKWASQALENRHKKETLRKMPVPSTQDAQAKGLTLPMCMGFVVRVMKYSNVESYQIDYPLRPNCGGFGRSYRLPRFASGCKKAYVCSSCAGIACCCAWLSCHAVVCQLSFATTPLIHGGSSRRK